MTREGLRVGVRLNLIGALSVTRRRDGIPEVLTMRRGTLTTAR